MRIARPVKKEIQSIKLIDLRFFFVIGYYEDNEITYFIKDVIRTIKYHILRITLIKNIVRKRELKEKQRISNLLRINNRACDRVGFNKIIYQYDEGLGEFVYDTRHKKQLLKEKGLVEFDTRDTSYVKAKPKENKKEKRSKLRTTIKKAMFDARSGKRPK